MAKTVKNEIIKIDKDGIEVQLDEALIEKYIQNPAAWFVETATGVATYGKKDFILAGGQLLASAIKLDLWGEFLYQLKEANKKGKTKRKFYNSRHGRINLNELFGYLDKNESPDEDVFKAIKDIFFASIQQGTKIQDEVRAYQLIQVCKKLKSVDILVLLAAYKLYLRHKEGENLNIRSTQDWQVKIAEMIDLPIDLVVQVRIQYHGTAEGTRPFLFEVEDRTNEDIINIGLNALSIAIGDFITKGRSSS